MAQKKRITLLVVATVFTSVISACQESEETIFYEVEHNTLNDRHHYTGDDQTVLALQGTWGGTILHWTAAVAKEAFAECLLNAGADVDVLDTLRGTPLHWACQFGNLQVVQFLIAHGADINHRDIFQTTVLHVAAAFGQPYILAFLLSRDSKPDVNARNREHETPLHLATDSGNILAVELLRQAGADMNARDNEGQTPLHRATLSKTSSSTKSKLIHHLLQFEAHENAQDNRRQTPLHLAATSPHNLEAIKHFIQAGAAINAEDENKQTPLHRAATTDSYEVALLLLRAGAAVDAQDHWSQTPLHKAAQLRHYKVIHCLIRGRANVHAKDRRGKTALQLAYEHCQSECIILLVNAGARITDGKPSLLQMAAEKADSNTFKFVKAKAGGHAGYFNPHVHSPHYTRRSQGKKHRVLYLTEDDDIEVREYNEPGPPLEQGYPQHNKRPGNWAYDSHIGSRRQKTKDQRGISPYSGDEMTLGQASFPFFW